MKDRPSRERSIIPSSKKTETTELLTAKKPAQPSLAEATDKITKAGTLGDFYHRREKRQDVKTIWRTMCNILPIA